MLLEILQTENIPRMVSGRNQLNPGPFNSYAGIRVNLSKNWSVHPSDRSGASSKHR
jgi:hypothetical protein